MITVLQCSINITMEATITLVLVVLLITCIFQKKTTSTTTPIIFLISSTILMLINHILMWSMFIRNDPYYYRALPIRSIYIFDYIFSYFVCVSFYYYAEAMAADGYRQIGVTYIPQKKVRFMIFAWGVVTTVIYSVLLFVPSIYRVENGVAIFSIPAYVLLNIMTKFALVCALTLIIRHRKVVGKQEAILSFILFAIIAVLVVVDEIIGLCISYVLVAILIIILYVRIDLNNGLLFEIQERELTQYKTQIMLSQMQPHFLYNVLTTISSMCEMQNAVKARDVVNRFSDYFRANLDSLGKERTIPFEKELEHIKTYLWLEKIRFEDAFNICYEIEITDFRVPSLTIQPVVENSVKHGLLGKEEPGTVTIRTYETPMDYVISVEDDGVGFDTNEPWDTSIHVGIDNVRKRLEIICSGTLEIRSKKGEGTVVTIHIPISLS